MPWQGVENDPLGLEGVATRSGLLFASASTNDFSWELLEHLNRVFQFDVLTIQCFHDQLLGRTDDRDRLAVLAPDLLGKRELLGPLRHEIPKAIVLARVNQSPLDDVVELIQLLAASDQEIVEIYLVDSTKSQWRKAARRAQTTFEGVAQFRPWPIIDVLEEEMERSRVRKASDRRRW